MATPFLKWAGGKARLAPLISERLGPVTGRYHEPFVGGGAVFFALQASGALGRATLNDGNPELVACYEAVRDQPQALLVQLEHLERAYLPAGAGCRAELYYRVRAELPTDPIEAAARLVFLNRTCYNGLYRVNRAGRFNVPHGRYANPRISNRPGIEAASEALAGTDLHKGDFEAACERAVPGDVVYLDPPYQPLSTTSSFTDYTRDAFGPPEQQRLRNAYERLTAQGVRAILSNSDHPAIRDLYEGRGYAIDIVPMSRAINSVASRRAPIGELLVDNLPRLS